MMRGLAIGALVLTGVAAGAYANTPGSQCVGFTNDKVRLACYDTAISRTTKPASEIPAKACLQKPNSKERLGCYDNELIVGSTPAAFGSNCKTIDSSWERRDCYEKALAMANRGGEQLPAQACLEENRMVNRMACLEALIPWSLNPAFEGIAINDLNCASMGTRQDAKACEEEIRRRTENAKGWTRINHQWAVRAETSDFTDTTNVYLTVGSEGSHQCSRSGRRGKLNLTLQCVEGRTAIYVYGDCQFESSHSGYGAVDVRVDKQEAFKIQLDASRTSEAIGLWNQDKAIPFIKGMFGGENLLVRVAPFSMNHITMRFPIQELEAQIEPLRKECGW